MLERLATNKPIIKKKRNWILILFLSLILAVSGVVISAMFFLLKPEFASRIDFSAFPNDDYPVNSVQGWTASPGSLPGSKAVVQDVHYIGHSLNENGSAHSNMLALYGDVDVTYKFKNPSAASEHPSVHVRCWPPTSTGYVTISILNKNFNHLLNVVIDVGVKEMTATNDKDTFTVKNGNGNDTVDFTITFVSSTSYKIKYDDFETLDGKETAIVNLDSSYASDTSIQYFYISSYSTNVEPVCYLEYLETTWVSI